MQIISITRCKKDLDFNPRASESELLVPYAFQGQLLNGFHSDKFAQAIELNDKDVSLTVFFSIYRKLNLSELSRLHTKLIHLSWPWNFDQILSHYNYRAGETLYQVLDFLKLASPLFQNWVDEKDLGIKDLLPAVSASLPTEYLDLIIKLKPSRSEGVQILELLADLKLMSIPAPLIQEGSALKYIQTLRALRYPMRTQLELDLNQKAKLLSWPRKSEVRWNFNSDTPTLEFKCEWSDMNQFIQSLASLKSIESQINKSGISPWPK